MKSARKVKEWLNKRSAARHAARNKQRQKKHDEKAFTINETLREYEKAYCAAHDYTPQTKYENGWVIVNHYGREFKYRLRDVERLTQVLWAKIHEAEINSGEQE